MSSRIKTILIGLLAVLVLGAIIVTTISTVQAFQNFQQQHTHARSGDVRAIRPWMTIHYIARIYHVPEGYLYQTLHISYPAPLQHANLTEIAKREHRPVDELIRTLQVSVLAYRRSHLSPRQPYTPPVSSPGLSFVVRRVKF